MSQADLDQIAYWNGEVGERWAQNQARLDALFSPLTEILLARADLQPGAAVLDIGCGAGETAIAAACRVGPRGRVAAIDLSAPLLAVARMRAVPDGATAITWIEADAAQHPFEAARFDHLLSRFGVMFFSDSDRAFTRLRGLLVPGRPLTFLCWRAMAENPWVAIPREAVLPLLPPPEPPAPDAPCPFRFADRDKLETLLGRAGFRRIAIEALDRSLVLGRSDDGSAHTAARRAALVAAELGPVARLLRDYGPDLRARALEAVASVLAPRARDGCVALDAGCWLVRAWA